MNIKTAVTGALIVGMAAGIAIGLQLSKSKNRARTEERIVRQVRIDTIAIRSPRMIKKILISHDTILLASASSVKDTVECIVPREQAEYSDTTFRAWVSGYNPRLDSIEVYPQRETITILHTEPARRWHIGPSVGVGVTPHGGTPFAGISVTYSLWSF